MNCNAFKVEIHFGVGKDAHNVTLPASHVHAVIPEIKAKANALFHGCTLLKAHGSWNDDGGETVGEPARVLQIITRQEAWVAHNLLVELCAFIKHKLNQAEVWVTVMPCELTIY